MKIIKVNDSQEKVKYEIYNMQLNQEKARRYREELVKKIGFYRLEFKKSYDWHCNGGLSLNDYIEKVNTIKTKYIYEFLEVPKAEESVFYGDTVKLSWPNYHLYSYFEYPKLHEEDRKKGLTEQKEFLKQFVEEGLSKYNFKQHDKIAKRMHTYIFLNSFGFGSKYSDYCYTDNVVCLPNEVTVMYLLEKGYIEEAHYYINKIVDIEEEQKLFANFEFEKSTEFTQAQMQDLLSSGLLKEQALTRKRELDLYLTNFIK